MSPNPLSLNRNLSVLIDGVPVADGCRIRFRGDLTLSLYPDLLSVTVLNLSDQEYHLLRQGGSLSVLHSAALPASNAVRPITREPVPRGSSLLASGIVQDVTRETHPGGTETTIGFSLGLDLWQAPVSLSVEAGVSASETIRRLLSASGTPWQLLSFPGEDPVFSRPQAFFSRAADAIETALTAARVRACLTPSGLVVVPVNPSTPEVFLSESDLTDTPVYTRDCVLLSTLMAGWPIGRRLQLTYHGKTTHAVIVKQRFDADTGDGPWKTELLAEVLYD